MRRAARAVLAGVADATPKSGEGEVEMIRMLKSAKDSAVKARTQAINQMKALVVTAPAELRETLDGLPVPWSRAARASVPVVWTVPWQRPGTPCAPLPAATVSSEGGLDLDELIDLPGRQPQHLVDGFHSDSAATLLIAAGSNPDRLHSEAAFASLCGVSPIPARARLNGGGHRQANAALHRTSDFV